MKHDDDHSTDRQRNHDLYVVLSGNTGKLRARKANIACCSAEQKTASRYMLKTSFFLIMK